MKFKAAVILLVTSLMTASANAGLISSLASSGWEEKRTDAKYLLPVQGFDIRVYEWTPKANPKITCVFVAGNTNSTGVACYPKKK